MAAKTEGSSTRPLNARSGGADGAPGSHRASRLVDIATAVGVHVSTVSRALNGDPSLSIRPETLERIMETARVQGYRPNALARALKRHRTGALALVIPLMRNPAWIRLQAGALWRASERGYVAMMIDEPTDDPKPPGAYRSLIEESRVDGLLLATALRPVGRETGLAGIPHVYVNRRGPDPGNNVVMDEEEAIRLFLDHVASLGHRSVLLIDGPEEVDTVYRRVAAARRYSAATGISVVVRHAPATEGGGWDVASRIVRAKQLPTACGVGSINQLFGAMAALREAGVSVPTEVSLVSFDEDECLSYLDVPVTSVCMPLAELGAAGVDALIARIEDATAGDKTADGTAADGAAVAEVVVREPMFLVPRASVAPPLQGHADL
jgi:LacI family transcriptional regulator